MHNIISYCNSIKNEEKMLTWATPYIYRIFTVAYNDTKSETDTKYYISNPCLRTLNHVDLLLPPNTFVKIHYTNQSSCVFETSMLIFQE